MGSGLPQSLGGDGSHAAVHLCDPVHSYSHHASPGLDASPVYGYMIRTVSVTLPQLKNPDNLTPVSSFGWLDPYFTYWVSICLFQEEISTSRNCFKTCFQFSKHSKPITGTFMNTGRLAVVWKINPGYHSYVSDSTTFPIIVHTWHLIYSERRRQIWFYRVH